MKTFKQIVSVLTSAVMLSSTVALAAAANYPAPFVKNGMADVAIVWGSNAQLTDLAAAIDITSDLAGELAAQTATTGSSSSSSSVSGGDYVLIERSTDKFNLGEAMNDFYSSLDDEELSTVLADGVYTNDANDDFDFTQKIELSNALTLEHTSDDEYMDDKPFIGFFGESGDHVLNYTLDFTPDAAEGGTSFDDLQTTDITLLGRPYYVVSASGGSNGVTIEILDSANSAIVVEGQSNTVTVGDKSYTIDVTYVSDSNNGETILKVDGVTTNKLNEGDVYKVAEDTYVAVKNILYNAKENGVSQVEISIGSGKIELTNAQEIEINNEQVSDIDKYDDAVVKAYITNSSTDIDQIILEWTLGDDTFIAPGSEIVMPGFETMKLSMAGFVTPAQESTMIEADGDDSIKLTTEVTDGKVSLDLLYDSDGDGDWDGLGKSSSKGLSTTNGDNILVDKEDHDWFVASWVLGDDAESYVLKIDSIDDSVPSKNVTRISSVASGSSLARDIDLGETEDFGRVKLRLNNASEITGQANLTISASTGTVSLSKLYTKEGLTIWLPYNTTAPGNGAINLSNASSSASYQLTVIEESEDNDVADGDMFNVTLGFTGDDEAHVSSTQGLTFIETEDGSDKFESYVNSVIATKVLNDRSGDQEKVEIMYPGEESYAEVYVSETGAVVEAGESTTTSGTVKKLGAIAFKDSESSSYTGKNLIVVGGSCVNTVAASLLGSSSPLCGADFTTKTTVGAGSFLVETFSQANGKVATLVAGYNAGDTTAAAKYLTTQPVDTTAGKKEVKTVASVSSLI